jgi:hypothetical protein
MSLLAGKKEVAIGAIHSENGHATTFRVADLLGLAAAPTFAIMALLTAFDGSQQDMLCAAMQNPAPFGGMAPMYLLMSAFHFTPWLKAISRWRSGARTAGLAHEARM